MDELKIQREECKRERASTRARALATDDDV
jgi:hypothetical protein